MRLAPETTLWTRVKRWAADFDAWLSASVFEGQGDFKYLLAALFEIDECLSVSRCAPGCARSGQRGGDLECRGWNGDGDAGYSGIL